MPARSPPLRHPHSHRSKTQLKFEPIYHSETTNESALAAALLFRRAGTPYWARLRGRNPHAARGQYLRRRARPARHPDDLRRRQDRVAGLSLDRRALRPLHAHAPARPQPDRAVLRPHRAEGEHDGAGDRHPAAGRDLQGQRHRHGRRARVLPGVRRAEGELRGRLSRPGDHQAHHDQHPLGDGRHGPRPDAVAPRRDQRAAAARGRRRGVAVGRQGQPHRDQGHRAAGRPRAVDGPADEGRAREARRNPASRGPAPVGDPQGRRPEAVADPRSRGPQARRRSATPRRASGWRRPRPRRPRW